MSDWKKISVLSRRTFMQGVLATTLSPSLPLAPKEKPVAVFHTGEVTAAMPPMPPEPSFIRAIRKADEIFAFIKSQDDSFFQQMTFSAFPLTHEFTLPNAQGVYCVHLGIERMNPKEIFYADVQSQDVKNALMSTIRSSFSKAVKFLDISEDMFLVIPAFQAKEKDLRRIDRWLNKSGHIGDDMARAFSEYPSKQNLTKREIHIFAEYREDMRAWFEACEKIAPARSVVILST